jgi:hypothetical protein
MVFVLSPSSGRIFRPVHSHFILNPYSSLD